MTHREHRHNRQRWRIRCRAAGLSPRAALGKLPREAAAGTVSAPSGPQMNPGRGIKFSAGARRHHIACLRPCAGEHPARHADRLLSYPTHKLVLHPGWFRAPVIRLLHGDRPPRFLAPTRLVAAPVRQGARRSGCVSVRFSSPCFLAMIRGKGRAHPRGLIAAARRPAAPGRDLEPAAGATLPRAAAS